MNIKIIHNFKTDDVTWQVGDYFFFKETSEVYIVARTNGTTSLISLNDGGYWNSTNTLTGTFKDLKMDETEWVKLNNVKIEVS